MDIECKMQSNAGVGSRAQVSLSLYPAPVWQSFLTATGGTQIFFFFFFNTLAPDDAWKCPYSRAATGSASLLGDVGLDSPRRRVEMNAWFPMHKHML